VRLVPRGLLRILVPVLVAASISVPTALPAGAAVASAAAVTKVTVVGHGYGHGRGMGQYGAYGYATMYHWTYQRILARFYGHTTLGRPASTKDTAPVSVRLTALDGKDVRITSAAWFKVGNKYRFEAGQSAILRYTGGTTYTVYRGAAGCSGSSQVRLGTVTTGVVRSSVAAPGTNTAKMLTVCAPGAKIAYRGMLTFLSADRTTAGRRLVNTVAMGDYLKSVVPAEMPASWADAGGGWGAQAVKAQTIAARSYAATEKRYSYAKTCDTATCQVYRGAARNGVSREDARSTAAVTATSGIAIMRGSVVQNAEFSASTGGWTAGGTFPAVSDQGDATKANPYHNWTVTVSTAPLVHYVSGALTSVRVASTDGHGRALTVRLTGSTGPAVTITGDQFRLALGLRSTLFRLA
jgi:SpoIID/LytB domain protein